MKKKFKHKKLVIVLVIIVAAIIVLVGVAKRKLNSVAEATNIVQLEKVDKRDLSDFISLTGTVSGETKINYSSTAATEIKTVNVQVGDVVKEGDVIATLDKDSIQKQIDVLEKSLSNAAALNRMKRIRISVPLSVPKKIRKINWHRQMTVSTVQKLRIQQHKIL